MKWSEARGRKPSGAVGPPIVDPWKLRELALARRSVFVCRLSIVVPAAVVCNWQLMDVLLRMDENGIREYTPAHRAEKKEAAE